MVRCGVVRCDDGEVWEGGVVMKSCVVNCGGGQVGDVLSGMSDLYETSLIFRFD